MAAPKYVRLRAGLAALTVAGVIGGTAFFSLEQQAQSSSATPSPATSPVAGQPAQTTATSGSVQPAPKPASAPARRSRAS